jgi:DNA-binding response OmpR family regulator
LAGNIYAMTLTVPEPTGIGPYAGEPVRILLYSDNSVVRGEVREAVGDLIGSAARPIVWTEIATYQMAMLTCAEQQFDLVIMDNETGKLGGVGLVREMRNELDWQPVVLLLLARQQDAWLGAWSGADAALLQPVDPFELTAAVAQLLGVQES